MSTDTERLRRWSRRARPSRSALLRALFAGGVASLANAALFIGALALLVASNQRPGLHAVAFTLIFIELFAFLRSPLRFAERMAAHQLGFDAVVQWRQWLVRIVGHLDYDEWRSYASGDLLQRALDDTDGLQDLWLRFLLPTISTSLVLIVGDIVVATLPPRGHWLVTAVVLFALQIIGVGGVLLATLREFSIDTAVRRTRGRFRAVLIETGAVAPDVALLHRQGFLDQRLETSARELAKTEAHHEQHQRLSSVGVVVVSVLAVAALFLHATSSPVWIVVVSAIALATFDGLTTMTRAFAAAVHVNGSAERLEDMELASYQGDEPWPSDHTLSLKDVTLREGNRDLLVGVSLTIAPGSKIAITGASGIGKSTLLRALAGLNRVDAGSVHVGTTDLADIMESELRSNLSYLVSEPGLTRGFARDVLSLGRASARDSFADINALGVTTEGATRYEELSRGERVRVAIAQSCAIAPSIYILDEPTAALGADESRAVLELLNTLNATIIIATHDENVIAWSDVVLTIENATLQPINR